MSIFDGLPDPSAPAGAFFAGLAHGKAQQEEQQVKGALSAYAVNPDDQQAFKTLAQYRPELAIQINQDHAKRQEAATIADLKQRAAAGDRGAMAQLAGVDLDSYDKLADNQRQDLHARVDAIGNAALDIASRPEADRPAAWDAYIDQLSQQYPELAPLKGQYSPEKLNAAIAQAGQTKEHLDSLRPSYQAIPEGGTLVNTRDPAAVQSYMAGQGAPVQVRSIEEAHALPPGTQFIDPNGVHRVVPGGARGNAGGGFHPSMTGDFRGLPGETLTSGFRSPAHNREVGGVSNSYHMRKDAQGRPLARDSVPPPGMSLTAYYRQLKALNPDKDVILESDHIHMEPRS